MTTKAQHRTYLEQLREQSAHAHKLAVTLAFRLLAELDSLDAETKRIALDELRDANRSAEALDELAARELAYRLAFGE